MTPVVSFTKEVNPRLDKRPLVFNGRLVNRGLTSLVKETTGVNDHISDIKSYIQMNMKYNTDYKIRENCSQRWRESFLFAAQWLTNMKHITAHKLSIQGNTALDTVWLTREHNGHIWGVVWEFKSWPLSLMCVILNRMVTDLGV